ncbi:MAG: heme o synthase [Frankiaceae bacterium]|nr:heme o synthase [Frankiaceae bacterium]
MQQQACLAGRSNLARVVVSRFAKLAVATVAATLLLIGLGGLVRATGSGLGCPDWPGCYGKVLPPAGDAHAWIEHIHRYWASVVIALIGWLAVEARRSGQPAGVRRLTLWGLVPLVVGQAVLGAVVVWIKLQWLSVSGHLTLALSVLALATWLAVDALRRDGVLRVSAAEAAAARPLARMTAVTTALVFAQMILGSMVTGFDAGMAYGTFPSFNGHPLPRFNHGFVFRQSLHVGHRLVAFALLAMIVGLLIRSARRELPAVVRRCAQLATLLVVGQIFLGALNVWWALRAWSVVPHMVVGASLFVTVVVAAMCTRPASGGAVGADDERVAVAAL